MQEITATGFEWAIGTKVRKKSGSQWRGTVVGFYTNPPHTDEGYNVASDYEPGNVQVYPRRALELWFEHGQVEPSQTMRVYAAKHPIGNDRAAWERYCIASYEGPALSGRVELKNRVHSGYMDELYWAAYIGENLMAEGGRKFFSPQSLYLTTIALTVDILFDSN